MSYREIERAQAIPESRNELIRLKLIKLVLAERAAELGIPNPKGPVFISPNSEDKPNRQRPGSYYDYGSDVVVSGNIINGLSDYPRSGLGYVVAKPRYLNREVLAPLGHEYELGRWVAEVEPVGDFEEYGFDEEDFRSGRAEMLRVKRIRAFCYEPAGLYLPGNHYRELREGFVAQLPESFREDQETRNHLMPVCDPKDHRFAEKVLYAFSISDEGRVNLSLANQ